MTGTSHEEQRKIIVISRLILLKMKNISDKSYRGNQNTLKLPLFLRKKIIYNLKGIIILCNNIKI